MAEIKFGNSQRKNPTPSSHSNIIDLFSGISGVVTAWVATAPYIPSEVSNIVVSILGLLVGIAQVIKPMWGVQVEANSVPTTEVKEIDDTKINT